MVPDVGENGLLPPGRHLATWEELQEKFVKEAPFGPERAFIFTAIELHFQIVSSLVPAGRAWMDGGFTTHKKWAAPRDVDVAYVIESDLLNQIPIEEQSRFASLITLQDVVQAHPLPVVHPRVQPMGGLVDAFLVPGDRIDDVEYWDDLWSSVKGDDGQIVDGLRKGYLEVTW